MADLSLCRRFGSAAIKGETLRLSLDPAWRADPDRSPIDTGLGKISLGRRVATSVDEVRYPRLQRSGPPYQDAHGAKGSDGGLRSAL